MILKPLLALLLACAPTACLFGADIAPNPEKEKEKQKEIDSGIPIASEVVRNTCSPCHKVDEKMRMSRISYRRTTPEGWEQTIKRMIDLNGLQVQPDQARAVLKYLATNLGLAPEESKPAAWEVEKRLDDFKYTADKDTETTCTKCHSFGRVMLQRRTKTDWEYLVAMHRGYYPLSDFQAFRRLAPAQTQPGPDGRPAGGDRVEDQPGEPFGRVAPGQLEDVLDGPEPGDAKAERQRGGAHQHADCRADHAVAGGGDQRVGVVGGGVPQPSAGEPGTGGNAPCVGQCDRGRDAEDFGQEQGGRDATEKGEEFAGQQPDPRWLPGEHYPDGAQAVLAGDAGMVGVVGEHARAEAGRQMGVRRL